MSVPMSYSLSDAVFNVASDSSRNFDFVSLGSKFILICSAILVAYAIIDVLLKHSRAKHNDNE